MVDGELGPQDEKEHECVLNTVGTLSATPNEIRSGDNVTLSWSVVQPTGCDFRVFLNGRNVPASGSDTVQVLSSTDYALTVRGTALARTEVEVELCPVVDILGSSREWARLLVQAVGTANTTVRLAESVNMDLTDYDRILIKEGVTLTSELPATLVLAALQPTQPESRESLDALSPCPPTTTAAPAVVSGRTGEKLGPRLFTRSRPKPLFFIRCDGSHTGDNVRLFGFRLHGPKFGQENEKEIQPTAIQINACTGIEIANMELAGWSGQAIEIRDDKDRPRISKPEEIRIHDNFIHHNQHKGRNGYGVNVNDGAYALITHNAFDFNRHAIKAKGENGVGYRAHQNLVLKGGGRHGKLFNEYTHQFDVHGDRSCLTTTKVGDLIFEIPWFGSWLNCGGAGDRFSFTENTFQYVNDKAIKLRGTPHERALIADNVFAHKSLDDALSLHHGINVDLGTGSLANEPGMDTYGRYGVCDLDGDGQDDLFLATGTTWWYSSAGRMHWVHLSSRSERLDRIGLGYFDDDRRCDVLTPRGNRWVISSGGSAVPHELPGTFPVPFEELRFGDFNGDGRTDVFRRDPDGQWSVVSPGVHDWRNLRSSQFPLDELRFGDFDGDGVTDVLSLNGGHWSYAPGGDQPWRPLNPDVSTKLKSLVIADVNANGTDDVIRFIPRDAWSGKLQVSWDGRSGWETLEKVTSNLFPLPPPVPILVFAGKFDDSTGADILLVDENRLGLRFSTTNNALVPHSLYAY